MVATKQLAQLNGHGIHACDFQPYLSQSVPDTQTDKCSAAGQHPGVGGPTPWQPLDTPGANRPAMTDQLMPQGLRK
jgi:hypothetical protein